MLNFFSGLDLMILYYSLRRDSKNHVYHVYLTLHLPVLSSCDTKQSIFHRSDRYCQKMYAPIEIDRDGRDVCSSLTLLNRFLLRRAVLQTRCSSSTSRFFSSKRSSNAFVTVFLRPSTRPVVSDVVRMTFNSGKVRCMAALVRPALLIET